MRKELENLGEKLEYKKLDMEEKRKEIPELANKINRLSREEIDILWSELGWSEGEKGDNLALPDWKINVIKESNTKAEDHLYELIFDGPSYEAIDILNEIKQKLGEK